MRIVLSALQNMGNKSGVDGVGRLTNVNFLVVRLLKTNFGRHVPDEACKSSKLIKSISSHISVSEFLRQAKVKQLHSSLPVEPNVVGFLRRRQKQSTQVNDDVRRQSSI